MQHKIPRVDFQVLSIAMVIIKIHQQLTMLKPNYNHLKTYLMMVGDLVLMVVVDLLLHYGEAGTHPHLEVLMSRVLRLMAGLVATKYKTKL